MYLAHKNLSSNDLKYFDGELHIVHAFSVPCTEEEYQRQRNRKYPMTVEELFTDINYDPNSPLITRSEYKTTLRYLYVEEKDPEFFRNIRIKTYILPQMPWLGLSDKDFLGKNFLECANILKHHNENPRFISKDHRYLMKMLIASRLYDIRCGNGYFEINPDDRGKILDILNATITVCKNLDIDMIDVNIRGEVKYKCIIKTKKTRMPEEATDIHTVFPQKYYSASTGRPSNNTLPYSAIKFNLGEALERQQIVYYPECNEAFIE